jgi:hypothetical protein
VTTPSLSAARYIEDMTRTIAVTVAADSVSSSTRWLDVAARPVTDACASIRGSADPVELF